MLEDEPESSSPKKYELESSLLDDVVVTDVLALVTRWAVPGCVARATAAKPARATAAVMPIAYRATVTRRRAFSIRDMTPA
jgi:hypothetical protein